MPVIPIYRGRGKAAVVVAYTVVDEGDFENLSGYRWTLCSDGYAVRSQTVAPYRSLTVRMHREIVGLDHGDEREADHKDRDRLNNRRSNLRIVLRAANRQNQSAHRTSPFGPRTSRHRGVSWDKRLRNWHACCSTGGKTHHIGRFDNEQDAARAASEYRAQHMPYATS